MVNRREFLGMAAGAGATLTLTPELVRALQLQQPSGKLIQRAIPSTGEMLPVIGVARGNVQDNARLKHLENMLDPSSEAYAMLKAVVKTMVDNGGRVLDSAWGGVEGQRVTSMIANDLKIQNKIFWSTELPRMGGRGGPPPDAAALKADLEAVFARLKVSKIDLLMLSSGAFETSAGVIKEAKKEGRVRYIGVDFLAIPIAMNRSGSVYAPLESLMRNEPIDFIGVPHYHVADRRAEETLLPLAQERKIGVVAYMPFGLGKLFQRASTTPLPEWAAEFDAKTWAQLFLKYLVSHPAVTVVLPGTSSATHMLDNIGGGVGRLPNEAMRKRIGELVDSLPPWHP
jgi:diketogulonate reductase-like aldo/keto reductase